VIVVLLDFSPPIQEASLVNLVLVEPSPLIWAQILAAHVLLVDILHLEVQLVLNALGARSELYLSMASHLVRNVILVLLPRSSTRHHALSVRPVVTLQKEHPVASLALLARMLLL
jgi:hypothetical protein